MSDPAPASTPPVRRGSAAPGTSSGIQLGSIAGFRISLDYSWFILFFLILVSFTAIFRANAPDLERLEYLLMGSVGTVLFFASLLAHELSHSFVARWKGVEVEGITLFIFGGMAKTSREASSPGDEFLIAVVGPIASLVLAAGFYGIALSAGPLGLGVTVVAEYLAIVNLALALFNLLPGFPLDGGRLLRATLWRTTGSFRKATRLASLGGRLLGWAIIGLGVFSLIAGGGVVGGLWFIFIGWFLGQAAKMSYQQVLLQELMSPLTAQEAMTPEPETVSPDLPLEELVHDYFLRRQYNAFPVTQDGVVIGLVTLGQVKKLPKAKWKDRRVVDIMTPLEETAIVPPDTPMMSVLQRMRETDAGRVLVAREWELLGIISATDITRWMDRVSLLEGSEGNGK
ncbi:MAG: site-2 protease family protein [Gemmatimonadota bacterium]